MLKLIEFRVLVVDIKISVFKERINVTNVGIFFSLFSVSDTAVTLNTRGRIRHYDHERKFRVKLREDSNSCVILFFIIWIS
jgi:hypothetical protein